MKRSALISEAIRPSVGECGAEITWHFSDPEACDALRREAIEWLYPSTPFREFSMAKGRGGGVDCLGLGQALHEAAGVIPKGKFKFQRCSADYSSANTLPKILEYLRGQVDDEQSRELAQIYAEIQLPRDKTRIKIDIFMPGDFAVMRDHGQFHFAIMVEGRHFVNALPGRGVTEGNIHDFTFSEYLIALFRARAR